MDSGPAAKAIGERAEHHLTKAQAEEESRDDELDVVPARHSEVVADGGQRRQHRVGGERRERHQQGDEGNELAKSKGGCDGRSVHSFPRNHVTRLLKSSGWSTHTKWSALSRMCIWALGMLL